MTRERPARAVEPDERMRAVLARRLPDVRLLAGRAESLPLPDASVDAVLVSSAWHWLDVEAAVPEIARVLRSGGLLGILWTSVDRETGLGAELWRAGRDVVPGRKTHGAPHRPEAVRLPAGAPFTVPEIVTVRSAWRVSPRRLAGVIGTYSSVITLPAAQRERLLAGVRSFVDTYPSPAPPAAGRDGSGRSPRPPHRTTALGKGLERRLRVAALAPSSVNGSRAHMLQAAA